MLIQKYVSNWHIHVFFLQNIHQLENNFTIARLHKHLKVRPFQCKFCQGSFYHNSSLEKHQCIHIRERHFKCKTSIVSSSTQKTQMCTHISERPYKCETCNSSFKRLSHLNNHFLAHSGERRYKCKICKSTFIQSSSLKRHLFVHSGERLFKCETCNSSFSS